MSTRQSDANTDMSEIVGTTLESVRRRHKSVYSLFALLHGHRASTFTSDQPGAQRNNQIDAQSVELIQDHNAQVNHPFTVIETKTDKIRANAKLSASPIMEFSRSLFEIEEVALVELTMTAE